MTAKNIFKQWFKTEDAPAPAAHAEGAVVVPAKGQSSAKPSSNAVSPADAKTSARVHSVLGRRWQTEKATHLEADATYSFLVHNTSNAYMVAEAFRAATGVKPEGVHMLWRFPKRAVRGHLTRRKAKLARITVAKGTTVKFPGEKS